MCAGSSTLDKKNPAQKLLANHFVPSGKSVEIDVVAQQASTLPSIMMSLSFEVEELNPNGSFK